MNKETLKEILKKIYDYLRGKGWSDTLLRVLLGAAGGIICALWLSGCSVSYKTDDVNFRGEIISTISEK